MSEAPDRRAMIGQLRELPRHLRAAVRALADWQLDTPYRENGWTVRQVVHHVADSHMNAFVRTKLILTEDHPTLKPYSQDDWAATADAAHHGVEASLALVEGLHERWAVLFDGLPETAWRRTGHHPERGELSVAELLELYSRHGEHHVGQILGLRRARSW